MAVKHEHLKTFPTSRIAETLVMFLRLRGGEHSAMNAALIPLPLADYYDLPAAARALTRAEYYANDKKPGRAWDNEVAEAAKRLKADGQLLSTTQAGRTVWRLTPDGATYADFWLARMAEKKHALQMLVIGSDLVSEEAKDGSASAA